MKYFIVGLHSVGKQETLNYLRDWGVKCGKLFSNLDTVDKNIYNSDKYETYTVDDINEVFENDAYVFIKELPKEYMNFSAVKYFEGLSKHTLDNNQVFALSPDQVLSITPKSVQDDVCFVWMDSTKTRRSSRYHSEHREYNYKDRDDHERKDLSSFVKTIHTFNNSPIIYFMDEEPIRVATIIYNTIIHPDTLDMFVKNFN